MLRKTALISFLFVALFGVDAFADFNRQEEGYWKTEKAKFLDDETFLKNLKTAKQNDAKEGGSAKNDIDRAATMVLQLLLIELGDTYENDKTIRTHIETVLTTLGALTGFSCQMAGREALIETGKAKERELYIEVKTKEGKRYYFGEFINKPLVGAKPISVWDIVSGAAQKSGAKSLPDIDAIFKHNAKVVGSDDFGIPVLPAQHKPQKLPVELLNKYWNPVRNILAMNTNEPSMWPFVLGLATQKFIIILYDEDIKSIKLGSYAEITLNINNKVEPSLAAKIFMEAAIPMSKMDPDTIHHAYLYRP